MIQGMRGYCQQHFWKDAPLELKTSLGAGQDEEVWNLRAEETLEATWLLPAPAPIIAGSVAPMAAVPGGSRIMCAVCSFRLLADFQVSGICPETSWGEGPHGIFLSWSLSFKGVWGELQ